MNSLEKHFPDYLSELNPQQLKAVLHTGSPLLILAGAGSGKTRVITAKIAYLIDKMGVDPRSILAVTFTNKAAREMKERVQGMVPGAGSVTLRTFHSFGSWLLRRNAHLLNMNSNFAIYDDDDVVSLLHTLFTKRNKRELVSYARWISRAKDYCLGPSDELDQISFDPDLPEIYSAYEKRLREIGNTDFGNLIMSPVELLRDNPVVRDRIQKRFSIVLVDEYQDSNIAQFELLKYLKGDNTYLCIVGDDDQSIYGFRGAEVKNILTFPDSFPGTQIIRLEENYRSTEKILDAASSVVSNNTGRLGKTLWTSKKGGADIIVNFLGDHTAEAEYCAELLKDGNLKETAILYRTNAQSLAFETCFLSREIPYKIIGSLRFFEREEIKDTLAYLALFVNPKDEVAYRRIINKPAKGLGAVSLLKVIEASAECGDDLIEASKTAYARVSSKAAAGLKEFYGFMTKLKKTIDGVRLTDFVQLVIKDSGLLAYHKKQDEIRLSQKVNNLDELVNASIDYEPGFEGLSSFLEDIELDRSRMAGNEDVVDDAVTLITMHNTKGLEFDRVIISGMENDLFPGNRIDEDIEEERRIFYVALTRARKELYLTSCRSRYMWGKMTFSTPSVFLGEIPSKLISYYGAVKEEKSEYSKGTRVYSDEYGSGSIYKVWHNGSEEIVLVRFDSGRTAQFIPAYTPLERISDDY